MKKLNIYLKESLLDDFDDLMDVSDKEVQHTAVDSPEFIEEYGGGWKVEKDTAVLNAKTYEGKKMNINFNNRPYIKLIKQKPVDEWLRTKEVLVKGRGLWLEGEVISKDTFTKKLIIGDSNKLNISGRNLTIKDIDIEVSGNLSIASDWGQAVLGNTTITINKDIRNVHFHGKQIPCFMNFKTNAKEMQISDTCIFDGFGDDAVKQLDAILELPYTCKVYDNTKKTEVDIKIKTFKKIHALINNHRRYRLVEPVLRFKQGAKLNDLLDVSGCKDLRRVSINNNLVWLELSKGNIGDGKIYPHMAQLGDWIVSILKR